jgi:hypothetical protein
MAARGWATSITTAIGVAAGAGAAQLGLGYGLGIVAWIPDTAGNNSRAYLLSLCWVLWIGGTSTVIGAVCADRLGSRSASTVDGDAPRGARALDIAWRVVTALAAAIGALITVPLVAVPARAAHRPDNFLPQVTAGGYAIVGVIVGLLVAIAALSARAVAANAIASVSWMWVLAVISVVDGLRTSSDLGTAQLAVWDLTIGSNLIRNMYDWPSAVLMLGAALVIGVLAAWPASRRGDARIAVALSGFTGPLLVAAAYVLTAPGLSGVDARQLSAIVIAPWAVLAGLAGSVLIAAVGAPRAAREPKPPREPKMGRREEEAALSDWAQALSSMDKEHGEAAPGEEARDSRSGELDEDSYAPPRAYESDPSARAYATDSVEASESGSAGGGTATTTSVKEPLWPEQTKPAQSKGKPKK